ncbi:hypothetical protein C8R44DRAFT_750443 [Mycena epipterygia]|nr:hypothetical protein C8R44DRAFT_750443 [Mycena epipterygia]
MQVQGHNAAGNFFIITIPGNEAVVDAAKKNTEAWLLADKKAHTLIMKAVLNSGANQDPVNWRQVMIQLYRKLRDADPYMMPDNEFAKHLVTLMLLSDTWQYCCDSLREKGKERVVLETAVPSIYATGPSSHGPGVHPHYGQSSNQNDRRNEKSHERQGKHPGPFNVQQRSAPQKFCKNTFCETPVGHSKVDCFSSGGGKAGKYPEGFHGRKDVHLSPEARVAARCKQAFESSRIRLARMVEFTEDGEEEVSEVFQTVADRFVFMLELPRDTDDKDNITIDEEIHMNTAALNLEVAQDDTMNHDTGASHYIFHKQQLFHEYTLFETPLDVHRFGSRSDRKGVSTRTGNGKITYLNAAGVYRMDVVMVEPNSGIDAPDLIAAMVPSVTSLFGPGTESTDTKRLHFITI